MNFKQIIRNARRNYLKDFIRDQKVIATVHGQFQVMERQEYEDWMTLNPEALKNPNFFPGRYLFNDTEFELIKLEAEREREWQKLLQS